MNELREDTTSDAVDRFVQGAETMLTGRFLDIQTLFDKGLGNVKDAIHALDTASSSGRDPLLPLLEHDNEMVQVIAGAALWQSHTDRARDAIKHVDTYGITEASMLAWKVLLFHGRYNPVPSDPRFEGLYDGDHDAKRFHDPELSIRAFRGQLQATFARVQKPASSAG